MTDNTRDLVIENKALMAALTAQVDDIKTKLDRLHSDISSLQADLNERRGAEKLAKIIHTVLGGATGAAIIKTMSWLSAAPPIK